MLFSRFNLKSFFSLLPAVVLVLVAGKSPAKDDSWSLSSPDKQSVISVSLEGSGQLSYQVLRDGKVVIPASAMGLRRDDEQFETGLKFKQANRTKAQHEKYDLLAGTQPHVDHELNNRTLEFLNTNGVELDVELAAGNEGVAFRYAFPEHSEKVKVMESELTSFTVPANADGWMQPYHAAGPYTPAYEDFFFHVVPGDPPPDSRQKAVGWAFPALFHVPSADSWVLLTEAGTDPSYCACHLSTNCAGGIYRIAFPLANETTKGYTNKFGPEPRYTLPWRMPWRVMVLGKSAGDIATSTLVTDLSAPSQIEDTSWIKPGRASWGWWSYPDGPTDAKMFNHFTDFAAKMGWEYTLFDAGWWGPGLKPLAAYALSNGVMPMAWNYAADFYDAKQREAKLNEMADAGIRGVKVDFWCSDRQEAIAAQQALMRDAATRHMVVNLHGCTIPRGWQRTWPNVLSTEAVLGNESYFYEPRYTQKAAELNTVLPFTRNAVGPMDLTPVAISPKRYARTTTAAHELAAAIVFTSGIIHYADKPEMFESLPPEVLQIFKDAPARWDETRCLVGEPGKVAVFARRSGASWYIAGINGTGDVVPVNLDLSDFKKFSKRFLVSEGTNAAMTVAVTPLKAEGHWQHTIPARGGFILRLDENNTGTIVPETTIWFDKPAKDFTQSSPMGNGRLGAMMFGGVDEEHIVLNESSMWSGSPQDADRLDAYKVLPEIQKLLLEGKNVEAEALVNANFTCKGPGSGGAQYGCYQVLGNLHLKFMGGNANATVSGYHRQLSLDDAVTDLEYSRDSVDFHREMFVSKPAEAMVLHLTADKKGQISFDATMDRPERFETTGDGSDGLLMTGQLDNGTDGKGVRYAARIRVLHHGGSVSMKGNVLKVAGADEVTLFITAATDYRGFAGRQLTNPVATTLEDMSKAVSHSFKSLRTAHIADYQNYFHRVSLEIGPYDEAAAMKPMPERIQDFKNGANDLALPVLYFNFGRYLLISSSRPGGLPPNLQGIWAEEVHTPWNGDWHLDVNVEMNYWPAEICNLSELTQPLFALIASLQEPGEKTAKAYYNARGWVTHVIANPWGFTSPGESASWGATTGGSAWLCQHLWDHYLFTQDQKFLEWAYPIMKGAARFYSDLLIEDAKHQYLIVAPANSPENHFLMPDGHDAAVSAGTTVHAQMIRYLFNACIEASKILGVDEDFRKGLEAKVARLSPTPIGSDGRVMEWPQEHPEPELHHRHISHLWALYPGDEITPEGTPALVQAAKKTLEVRGDDGLGWSYAYRALLWARAGDGNHAWLIVKRALSPVVTQEIHYDNGGGVYPNLFDACPPFQIDGNFGVTAAIGEMLLQSQGGIIRLLPAIPDAWQDGKVTGLRARDGFQVDMTWRNGKLVSATIRSDLGAPCTISYRGKTVELKIKKGGKVILNGDLEKI